MKYDSILMFAATWRFRLVGIQHVGALVLKDDSSMSVYCKQWLLIVDSDRFVWIQSKFDMEYLREEFEQLKNLASSWEMEKYQIEEAIMKAISGCQTFCVFTNLWQNRQYFSLFFLSSSFIIQENMLYQNIWLDYRIPVHLLSTPIICLVLYNLLFCIIDILIVYWPLNDTKWYYINNKWGLNDSLV